MGYDAQRHVLEVEFAGGGVYRYYDVPESAYETVRDARSIGKTFNAWVRDRYSVERIDS